MIVGDGAVHVFLVAVIVVVGEARQVVYQVVAGREEFHSGLAGVFADSEAAVDCGLACETRSRVLFDWLPARVVEAVHHRGSAACAGVIGEGSTVDRARDAA